jgi:uncharacterized protein
MDAARAAANARARAGFHALIKPFGAGCNLRCEYCFYLEKRELFESGTAARMSDEVLEALTRAYIDAQPAGTTEVEFAWQGGEPTLAGIDFFMRARELQKRYARRGMAVRNSIQTNGTLLDEAWGRFLAAEGFLVGISIDGPRALHDRWRHDSHAGPSHERALAGLEVLRRHQVDFNTLTVVHAANAPHPREVYDFLVGAGSTFLQFIPLVEPLEGGGVGPRSVTPELFGSFLEGVLDRWLERKHVGEVFVRDFETLLALTLSMPAAHCASAIECGRCVAVERTGDVFACDHYIDWPHHLGNVRERSFAAMVDASKQARFGLAKSATLPRQCRECEYLRLCNGGCPKDRIAADRYGEPGLNHLCAGFQRFFAHAAPTMRRMAACLQRGLPASEHARFA